MVKADERLRRACGIAMVLAGLLMLAVGILSAQMPLDQFRTSPLFVWRMTAAVGVAALLLFGSVGLYAHHTKAGRPAIALAFFLGFVGSALLLAHEWQELFLARELAQRFPDTFKRLEDAPGFTPFDWEALIAASAFTFGWIALAVATLATPAFSKWGGALVIAGMFAVPVSAALMPVGPILASAILGAGYARLGLDLLRGPSGLTPAQQAPS